MAKMRYRLGIDLGTTSLGWALMRLDSEDKPCAVIKTGVRIFSNGRHPKTGTSLAADRRLARSMRRRRDRLLKRKARMMRFLVEHGFFPKDAASRKKLEELNPLQLRAEGLLRQLTPAEFARAIFHLNQRRGFKSNRKTDAAESDSSIMKSAIQKVRQELAQDGFKTVGQWLFDRQQKGQLVRARRRESPILGENGRNKIQKSYDLYIDRAMIEAEFDALWEKQASLNPTLFTAQAHHDIKDTLLFQRNLKPVIPGRCTLIPDKCRAPLALPRVQQFRIYQELNNLHIINSDLTTKPLTLKQRDALAHALEQKKELSFDAMRKLLNISEKFNLEDIKRDRLKGNITNAILSHKENFGKDWFDITPELAAEIVDKLTNEQSQTDLLQWLIDNTSAPRENLENISNVNLVSGYGSLSIDAIDKILPLLQSEVITYDKAVVKAGFDSHSQLAHSSTGEVLPALPYYGEYLSRHCGMGSGNPADSPEKRFGKIANPTVHIGLNQIRVVINKLIEKYGHPDEVIIELARDLKNSKKQKDEEHKRQADNAKRNASFRKKIADLLQIQESEVKRSDIEKMILWTELDPNNETNRRCPYSGVQISITKLYSAEIEIEHILPFSRTLDDSLNNKTVSTRLGNRIKGNMTPWEAKSAFASQGWNYDDIIMRASSMPLNKRTRFAADGYEKWLKNSDGFIARALTDTQYMSRIAQEYLSLICPHKTRAIPGRITALLRAKFGLNKILSEHGLKNREDHRHHAVDACVIAVTDQGLLQRFAQASSSARSQHLERLVENMPQPWDSYTEHVSRSVSSLKVSFRPDHGHEGAMHNDTAYGLAEEGKVYYRKIVDGARIRHYEKLNVIKISNKDQVSRHGALPSGSPKPYKGYLGDSNYCIDIIKETSGKWVGEVVSTFDAYQYFRINKNNRQALLKQSFSGKPLVMRLIRNDTVRVVHNNQLKHLRLCRVNQAGQMAFIELHEANVDARTRIKELAYIFKTPGTLQKSKGLKVMVNPIGETCK
jgi:CRISPR-associated endonuclease Csn1